MSRQPAFFDKVNVPEAWAITRGQPAVLVGVIDNGFDFFHPLLRGQLVPGFYHSGGYHTECYENVAHGTTVAGLIVARHDPESGALGLAPDCRVLTASLGMTDHPLLRIQQGFLAEHPTATAAELQAELARHADLLQRAGEDWVRYQVTGVAGAIRYLVEHGARVINISGYLSRRFCRDADLWQSLEDAFALARDRGVVIVLGAGNSAEQTEDYPGNAEAVIVAGASRLDDTRWEATQDWRGTPIKQGSCFGKRLTCLAPVANLPVCVPHDRRVYATADSPLGPTQVEFEGPQVTLPIGATSCAAPTVAALAALVCTVRPGLEAAAVVEIIRHGCDPLGPAGHDLQTGYGRVNFGRTLRQAMA